MITLPEVTVVGTLVADPELRFTSNGVAVANFRVASNDRKLNKETGKWEDGDATFLSCSIWRDYAEHVGESLSRGDRVVVVGRLRQREYEKDDGEKRTVYEVDAEEVTPSLRFANVKVLKVDRGGSSNGGGGNAGKESGFRKSGGGTKPADDPWGSVPPPSAPSDDEPPF